MKNSLSPPFQHFINHFREYPFVYPTYYTSRNQLGDSLEKYVAEHLSEIFPDAKVENKVTVNIAGAFPFECDIVITASDSNQPKPEFYIIECKNYNNFLEHFYVIEFWWRIKSSKSSGGMLFTTGKLSKRSLRIANYLGLKIMILNRITNCFEPAWLDFYKYHNYPKHRKTKTKTES